jgi:hypothetical protein
MPLPEGFIFSHEELNRFEQIGVRIPAGARRAADGIVWEPVDRRVRGFKHLSGAVAELDRRQRALAADLNRFVAERRKKRRAA